MAESTNNINYSVKVDTKTGKMNIDGLTSGFVKADKAVLKLQNDLAKGANTGGKSLKGLGDASGSATSSVMELSRVVSDAPYGIRGMANNITQLVSQMGTASVKAGGLTKALKLMWKQMLGPLGIVFAITAVVSAFDYFKGGAKKATESTEKLNAELKKEIEILEGLANISSNVNSSMDDRNNAIVTAIASNKSYAKSILEGTNTILGQEESLRALLEEKKKQLELDEEIIKVNSINDGILKEEKRSREEISESIKKTEDALLSLDGATSTSAAFRAATYNDTIDKEKQILKALDERSEAMERINALYEPPREVIEGSVEWWKQQISFAEKTRDQLSTNSKAYKNQTLIIKGLKKELEKITGTKEKRDKATAFDTSDITKDAKKYVDEVMKMEKKNALLLASNNVDKLIIEREFQLRRISRLKGDNSALIAEYTKYYDTLIKTAEEKLLGKSQIDPFAPRDLNDDAEKIKERQRLLTEIKLQALADSAEAVTGFLNGEFQRELDMEQNKTNALNNELNKRLLNENLSKDERKRIQLQIGANDEKLRIKQEQIEKKRFKLNKAANIAQATIATYLAAAQVMANPLDLNPVTKGIAMASTIAMGLANVATIARQKFQSSAGSGGQIGGGFGGGSGSGGNDRDFNFNLAGTSQQNQLAQTLQGRFDQPLQAYVVSTDITNQQQLDQEILGNATFG